MITGLKVLSAAIGVVALTAVPAQAGKVSKGKTSAPRAHTSQSQGAPIYGWAGQYRGTDPDPNIRFQLMRDQNLR
ncbi:MAG TPA: hypothetical protein VLU23_07305 [Pseudolabrys sp.]|jgi:hypothetical protein|nr:hypothetical protein [Pseudolabrys sp.]